MNDIRDESPDTGYIEARNRDLSAAFCSLSKIVDSKLELEMVSGADESGVTLNLRRSVGYCGSWESEYENVWFSWDELIDPDRALESGINLNRLAISRWDASRNDALAAARAAEVRRMAAEEERRERRMKEKKNREAKEREELRRLAVLYPDELNRPNQQ